MHPHQAYGRLQNLAYLKSVLENGELHSPIQIDCIESDRNRLKVVEKYFDHPITDEDERELDVIHTFFEITKFTNQVIFEYLVRECNELRLIKDAYKIRTPSSYARFAKNYGSSLGDTIESVTEHQGDIRFPTKIWVNHKDKMKRFSENGDLITWGNNWNAILSRALLRAAYDRWCEIVKITVYNSTIAYDRDMKSFKVYRIHMFGFVKAVNDYGEEFETLVNVSCKIHDTDLERLNSKEYRAFQVISDGRHAEDVSKWQTHDGKEFEKIPCFNWKD